MAQFESKKERSARIMKALLHRLDMNVSELSRETGVSYRTLYHIQSGETKIILQSHINKICERFPFLNPEFLTTGVGNIDKEENEPKKTVTLQDVLNQIDNALFRLIQLEDKIDRKLDQLTERETKVHEKELEIAKLGKL